MESQTDWYWDEEVEWLDDALRLMKQRLGGLEQDLRVSGYSSPLPSPTNSHGGQAPRLMSQDDKLSACNELRHHVGTPTQSVSRET